VVGGRVGEFAAQPLAERRDFGEHTGASGLRMASVTLAGTGLFSPEAPKSDVI
jgi:hypothetical protein